MALSATHRKFATHRKSVGSELTRGGSQGRMRRVETRSTRGDGAPPVPYASIVSPVIVSPSSYGTTKDVAYTRFPLDLHRVGGDVEARGPAGTCRRSLALALPALLARRLAAVIGVQRQSATRPRLSTSAVDTASR